MAIMTELVRLAGEAEIRLASLFGLTSPSTVVVPGRVAGSAYGAQFDPARNVIYIDAKELKHWDDLEIVHTIGEEVGHALHFMLRPELFRRSKPAKEEIIQAVEEGRHREQLRDALLSSNFIEMIGFLAGLFFLEARLGRGAAKTYRERSKPYLEPWAMPDALALIDEFSNLHGESVSNAFEDAPEKWRAKAEAARPNSLPKESNEVMIQLTHRMGYRLALDLHERLPDRQEEIFKLALRSESLLEFCEGADRLHEGQQCP